MTVSNVPRTITKIPSSQDKIFCVGVLGHNESTIPGTTQRMPKYEEPLARDPFPAILRCQYVFIYIAGGKKRVIVGKKSYMDNILLFFFKIAFTVLLNSNYY